MTTTNAPTVEALLSELHSTMNEADDLNERLAVVKARRDQIERDLLAFHKTTGLTSFSGAGIGVTVDPSAMRAGYDPEKWNDLVNWCAATGNQHLIQRRLTDSRVIDLWETTGALPEGLKLESYTKISVRRK